MTTSNSNANPHANTFQSHLTRRRLHADHVDTLLRRANHLHPHEQSLLRAALHEGTPTAHLAALAGVSPRTIRRRVQRLILHLTSRRFTCIERSLDHFTPTRRRIAIACELQRLSANQAAASLGMSVHAVRRQRLAIDAFIEASLRGAAA